MDDTPATRKPLPHTPPNGLRPTLAGGELVVVLTAFMSGLVLLSIRDWSEYGPFDTTAAGSRFQAVLPQLLVIALGATGFSRIGDYVAIVVGCWVGLLCGSGVALTEPGFGYFLAFLLQLFMSMVAIVHAWGTRDLGWVAVGSRRRLVGLGASAAVGVVWYLLALRP